MASTSGIDEEPQPLPRRRTSEWYHALGFDKPWGLHVATFYEKLTFGWGAPLLEKGSYGQITEEMADALPPPEDEAPLRAQQFADYYDQCQVYLCAQLASLCASFATHILLHRWPILKLRHCHAAGGLGFRQALVLEEQPICQDSSAFALAKDGAAWLLDIA